MTTILWHGPTKKLLADSRSTAPAPKGERRIVRDDKVKIITFKEEDRVFFEEQRVLAAAGSGYVDAIDALVRQLIIHGPRIIDQIVSLSNSRLMIHRAASLIIVTETKVVSLSLFPPGDGEEGRNRHSEAVIKTFGHDEFVVSGSGSGRVSLMLNTFDVSPELAIQTAAFDDDASGGCISLVQIVEGKAVELPRLTPMTQSQIQQATIEELLKRETVEEPQVFYTQCSPVVEEALRARNRREERVKEKKAASPIPATPRQKRRSIVQWRRTRIKSKP